jgi:hypothetical protein
MTGVAQSPAVPGGPFAVALAFLALLIWAIYPAKQNNRRA